MNILFNNRFIKHKKKPTEIGNEKENLHDLMSFYPLLGFIDMIFVDVRRGLLKTASGSLNH